ncbi:MAG: MATE family efflux transporter [Gemmatimonadota bacterium]
MTHPDLRNRPSTRPVHLDRPTRRDFGDLIQLAIPLVAVQVGLMLMGIVDTIMVGRVSAPALAAVAVANVYFFLIICVGMGIIYSLDPIVSQAVGAGDQLAITRGVQRGQVLALLVTIPSALMFLLTGPVLRRFGLAPEIVQLALAYMKWTWPGVLPYFGFLAARQVLQAIGRVRALVVVIVVANVINLVLDWALIFGHLGLPKLGVIGSAIATTVGRWAMWALLIAAAWRVIGPRLVPWRADSLAPAPLGRMLWLGFPIGLQILLEYGVFGLVGLLLGRIGVEAVAGHQIALNLAALAFMVALGIGAAAGVLVGRSIGAGDPHGARRAAAAALATGAVVMAAGATTFLLLPRALGAVYTNDPGVLAVAAALIPLAGIFQIFDGTQAIACGVLRGAGDTRVPMLLNAFGYWVVGLPVCLWLGFKLDRGPVGFWWGLVLGLVVAAVTLLIRVRSRLWKSLQRVTIDAPGA